MTKYNMSPKLRKVIKIIGSHTRPMPYQEFAQAMWPVRGTDTAHAARTYLPRLVKNDWVVVDKERHLVWLGEEGKRMYVQIQNE